MNQIPANSCHRHQPEQTQNQLAIVVGQLHSERHAGVKHIMQFKPVSNQAKLSGKTGLHIMVNGQLRCLVDTNQQKGEKKILERVFLNHIF